MQKPESTALSGRTPSPRLSKVLSSLFLNRAAVVAVEPVSDRFRLITFEGAALAGQTWTPGQKVQIPMGSFFAPRTYTPIEWDTGAGRTRILGYAHGAGRGSAWVLAVKPGDECDITGPRGSLDVTKLSGSLAVFGDETSIGLGHALTCQDRTQTVTSVFEVSEIENAQKVVARLGLPDARLFARQSDDSHLADMASTLAPLADAGASFVLTGKASTIQLLRQHLKHLEIPGGRIAAAAYWTPNKAGLD